MYCSRDVTFNAIGLQIRNHTLKSRTTSHGLKKRIKHKQPYYRCFNLYRKFYRFSKRYYANNINTLLSDWVNRIGKFLQKTFTVWVRCRSLLQNYAFTSDSLSTLCAVNPCQGWSRIPGPIWIRIPIFVGSTSMLSLYTTIFLFIIFWSMVLILDGRAEQHVKHVWRKTGNSFQICNCCGSKQIPEPN